MLHRYATIGRRRRAFWSGRAREKEQGMQGMESERWPTRTRRDVDLRYLLTLLQLPCNRVLSTSCADDQDVKFLRAKKKSRRDGSKDTALGLAIRTGTRRAQQRTLLSTAWVADTMIASPRESSGELYRSKRNQGFETRYAFDSSAYLYFSAHEMHEAEGCGGQSDDRKEASKKRYLQSAIQRSSQQRR